MRHNFETLSEIIEAINKDNIDTFLADFGQWLAIEVELKEQGKSEDNIWLVNIEKAE